MLSLVIDLVCRSRVVYLVIFTPIPDSVLMPDVLGSPSPDTGIECMPTRLKRLVPCLVFRDVYTGVVTRMMLEPRSLGPPRLINRVPIRTSLRFPAHPNRRYDETTSGGWQLVKVHRYEEMKTSTTTEDSLEHETKTLSSPLTRPSPSTTLNLGTRFLVVGEICNAPEISLQ